MKEGTELCKRIAYNAHLGQTRRDGTTPYIEHIEKVVNLVGDDEKLQCIAWLHDVIEDTDYTEDLLSALGVDLGVVQYVVELLTHRKGVKYFDYIGKIKTSTTATKVKIADIVANLSDKSTDKQIKKYYKALLILCRE